MNYTAELTQKLIDSYSKSPTRETVEALAKEFDKPIKSIIGKLSKEGVYQRQSYVDKTGQPTITKVELVSLIAARLDLDPEELRGMEKTPKLALKRLMSAL